MKNKQKLSTGSHTSENELWVSYLPQAMEHISNIKDCFV